MKTIDSVRNTFIDFFSKRNHVHIPSSSLIPHNDPSLMFVNSGMVQFKNVFTGLEKRDYQRAVTCQKSVRAGGKHNDLSNVGHTARHHTFFEMLGNFSFGDYFKERAIFYCWELLTKEYCLPKDKLYVTVYHTDEEALQYWQKISGLSEDRILKISTNDNFWAMGDTGPCGPCSEVFYDHGDSIQGGLPNEVNAEGDRYVEIWNMVFMQFEQIDVSTRKDLPLKSVDTGMGLERITAVLQGTHDNYEIDLFKNLISSLEHLTNSKSAENTNSAYRVISDHLRAISFLIADGILPSNEGRGYVLRRIMRRAMRYAHQLFPRELLLYKLVPKVVELMSSTYSELIREQQLIVNTLKSEEQRFKLTIERGLKFLEKATESISEQTLSGDMAFRLYDTYGFPLDLTEDILRQQNINVDYKGFYEQMQRQQETARKNWVGSGQQSIDHIWFDLYDRFGPTEFLGYKSYKLQAKVLGLICNNQLVSSINEIDKELVVIANQTPFYGESGGQVGDHGIIMSAHGKIRITDTKKFLGKIHAHYGVLLEGGVSVDDIMTLEIDYQYRQDLRVHHTATHLLHATLRQILGDHIRQKGSLVESNRLRFDFNHDKPLSLEQIKITEDKINFLIMSNAKISTCFLSMQEAIDHGAVALFDEKYDDEVRVVTIELDDESDLLSKELCGGTHVNNTGEIGSFKIISESSIAAGIRRIEAVAGKASLKNFQEKSLLINRLTGGLQVSPSNLLEKTEELLQSNENLKLQIHNLEVANLTYSYKQLSECGIVLNGLMLLLKRHDNANLSVLRTAAEQTAKNFNKTVVVFTTSDQNKISIVVAVSKDICQAVSARTIAQNIASFLGGNAGGGGSNTLAAAGGQITCDWQALSDHIIELLKVVGISQ